MTTDRLQSTAKRMMLRGVAPVLKLIAKPVQKRRMNSVHYKDVRLGETFYCLRLNKCALVRITDRHAIYARAEDIPPHWPPAAKYTLDAYDRVFVPTDGLDIPLGT